MVTMNDLKSLAAQQGIWITRKGYKMDGIYYRVDNWPEMLAMLNQYDPAGSQIAGWLRSAR